MSTVMRTVLDLPDRRRQRNAVLRRRATRPAALHDYCGGVHVHSTFSDGSEGVPEILEAAKDAGLDYLVLTDHAEMSLCEPEWQAWHDDVLLVRGCELSPRKEPHSLALELTDTDGLDRLSPAERLAEVNFRGGYSFIAHPRAKQMLGMRIPPWRDWHSPFITGVEVWSYTYDWLEAFRWRRAISCYRRPHDYIAGPHPEILDRWDRLAMRSPTSGIAGLDAHARPIVFKRLKVFPYEMMFRTTLTHVLLEELSRDPVRDARSVNEALCAGRCYMGYHVLGDPTGFRFTGLTDAAPMEMGDVRPLDGGAVLRVSLPARAEVLLIANGRPSGRRYGRHCEFPAEVPGAYRVEVRRDGRPWIFSNHIHLS